MTLPEIIAQLETLKDAVSDDRKVLLTQIQQAVAALVPTETSTPTVEKPVSVVPTVTESASDRRTEPRDPGETEQHLAESLKLA